MDRKEASILLSEALAMEVSKGYRTLVPRVGTSVSTKITSLTGREYDVKIVVAWDDEPGGDLRVIGNIDAGGFRAFFPVSDSVLVEPGPREGPSS